MGYRKSNLECGFRWGDLLFRLLLIQVGKGVFVSQERALSRLRDNIARFQLGAHPPNLSEGRIRGNVSIGRDFPRKRPSQLQSNFRKGVPMIDYDVIPNASFL